MTKSLVAVLLCAFAAVSFAQGASAPMESASAPAKHHTTKHHKAAPASSPMASDAKAGGK
jgi:hypothetical protein